MTDITMDSGAAKAPMSFWIVSALSLVWNSFGCADYTLMKLHNAAWLTMGGVSADMIAKIDTGPLWGTMGWAFGVWGSLAGSLLLLTRSRHAITAFMISIVGAVIGFAWQVPAGLADPIWLPVMIVIVVLLQWWFARRSLAQGILR